MTAAELRDPVVLGCSVVTVVEVLLGSGLLLLPSSSNPANILALASA
jgi:hypothetical protein